LISMKTKLLAVILFLLFSAGAFAQQTDSLSTKWTLKQCIDYALANSLSVKRGTYNVQGAEIDHRQNQWARVPNLNANVCYGYNWGRSIDPVTYQYTTAQLNALNPSLSSSVTLFNGFRVENSIKQSSRAYLAAEYDLTKAKNDVILNIASLYINVIFNKEQLENARFQLASSQAQLNRVKKQVAVGALARSEELNVDAQVASNEVILINQENALNIALLQLKQALQLPASTPLDIEVMDVTVEDLVLDQTRDQIYEQSMQVMPEIKSAKLRVESSYYAAKAAKGNFYPRLSLNASLGSNYSSASDKQRRVFTGRKIDVPPQHIGNVLDTNAPVYSLTTEGDEFNIFPDYGYRDQLKDNLSRSVGFTLSIPLFNNMQSRASWQRSVINREVTKITEKETENKLRQDVETAYNNATAASKTYNSNTRQVQAREEAFRMMEQRYNAGSANFFEYQVSQNDLFRAKSDLTRAKYDFIFRKKVLDFYQGKPLEY
jgi:outer membrane protein